MLKEIVIGAGGVVLIAAIITAVRLYTAPKGGKKVESIYVDEFGVGEMKKWFTDKVTKRTLKGVILYPTPENISKWKLNIDAGRQSNLLIQAVYDEEKEELVAYREVVFSTLSSNLKELLETNGGTLVIEN